MQVLLIRHAIAEAKDEFAATGQPDDKRPLSRKGREKMRAGARGLKRSLAEIDIIATSPLTRAQQTADIVAAEYPDALLETIDAMEPDADFAAFLQWLNEKRDQDCVAAVGHDPHISSLACWLTGADDGAIQMKKGSALLLEFDDELVEGGAQLRWFLKPDQLRTMGKETRELGS